ncbi:NAD-dependent epimerase/dehydratase family protein [Trujillonella endophytica]|uniref:Nucleoside-diphosphate-sugar epimerase n=1 Tax=Trujillonella endophytica TaxID=673521 RepID=A0A1H8UBK7_9ACTN|nr:NAD(P)-dependent oxidoreductase [Trujillella endophytica]SEP00575.1 Nucleoside-diphosphate-sugar epimerase [Trujillella endophytica]
MAGSLRVLVTGARGKVGSAAVEALAARGHRVVGTDLAVPDYDPPPGSVPYVRADLTDLGQALSVVRDVDAVVHTAAVPRPGLDPGPTVFTTNVAMTAHVVEACALNGVRRLVNLSSDSVCGITWARDPAPPVRLPIDEEHPDRPEDPYALSKQVSELLCDGLVRRSSCTAVSLRPTWVLTPRTYAASLGPFRRDPELRSPMFWSYVDVADLAGLIALAAESTTPGHEVAYAAAADNGTGRDLRAAALAVHPGLEVRPLPRPDASAISSAKAERLFGWRPTRSWRDVPDA